jgi:group II intron reverse transcriptase/maturase
MNAELNIYQKRAEGITYPSRQMLNYRDRTHLLQANLYRRAKQVSGQKFYILYDKVFLPYILRYAWEEVCTDGGSAGVDGVTIASLSQTDMEDCLRTLSEDLLKRTYRAQAVRRVWIPKGNGEKRPLGIPTVRDRIVQTACKLISGPIFEADFEESSYGFRPDRGADDAIPAIKKHLANGEYAVYDADLSKYFDTIPHGKLQTVLKQRISDPRILWLVKQWLKAPVPESDGQFTGVKKNVTGTPQGGVISPLLANIYMNLIDKAVNRTGGVFKRTGLSIIRYADDFILTGKTINAEAETYLKTLLTRTGLALNETKTRKVTVRDTPFNFLGFTIRYDTDLNGGSHKYLNIHPSKKSEQKLRDKVKDYLHRHGHSKASQIAVELNLILKGWLNYYTIPKVSYTKHSRRHLRYYLTNRLYRYYNRKSQRRSSLYGQQAYDLLLRQYGMIDVLKYGL